MTLDGGCLQQNNKTCNLRVGSLSHVTAAWTPGRGEDWRLKSTIWIMIHRSCFCNETAIKTRDIETWVSFGCQYSAYCHILIFWETNPSWAQLSYRLYIFSVHILCISLLGWFWFVNFAIIKLIINIVLA